MLAVLVGAWVGKSDTILKGDHLSIIPSVWSQLAKQFQRRRILKHFSHRVYVKTMSTNVCGLGWQVGSWDTILKGDHLRTIPTKFGPNWPSSFRGEDFLDIFPIGSYVRIMSADVGSLGWPAGSSDTFLKGTTQGPSLLSLVQISLVVPEEKIKM